MKSARIGLLPFYLKLYDDLQPDQRSGFDAFLQRIAHGFSARGISVETAPACRIAPEFEAALKRFGELGVDAVVTLHLAYSPSLEALDSFRRSRLPIIILDTTMDADFGPGVRAGRIMYNHGVHGVMDFASMLRRFRRPYEIVAGHDSDPDFLDRAAGTIRGAMASRQLQGTNALRVGPTFEGMGDFAVEASVLQNHFGMTVRDVGIDALDTAVGAVKDAEISEEMAADREHYACDLSDADHQRSVRVGLGLRRLLDAGKHGAFSVNFRIFDNAQRPAATMPFLEISKAMARGIGYGGEGDILTAALVGALARAFGATTFTEIFCADWSGNTLFLSHMGEISPTVLSGRPRLFAKPFFMPGVPPPAVLTGPLQPGPAVFVNLAPGPDDTFGLIVAPVDVLAENDTLDPAMRDTVRAWIRPRLPVADFLETYSRAGGTHHSALVRGDVAGAIEALGRFCGLNVIALGY